MAPARCMNNGVSAGRSRRASVTVSPELDAAMLVMPGAKAAKTVFETILERMAAKKGAGGLEVEAVVGAKEAGSTGLSNAGMRPFVPQLSRYEDRIKLTPINVGLWTGAEVNQILYSITQNLRRFYLMGLLTGMVTRTSLRLHFMRLGFLA